MSQRTANAQVSLIKLGCSLHRFPRPETYNYIVYSHGCFARVTSAIDAQSGLPPGSPVLGCPRKQHASTR
ncbi:hypothetical protein GQ602_004004 [Ophiocordyceps camponoti-floridani]|uniref:Uncharacterized protein n=1 Tax=Ophiocordyceps camponoti-floridani TaxID=2030778 RepID=A0A8H4Q6F7_9HYPO|nr:hypothetical protein GQ602_004004 [Ophiocordyceps camponoti-floridani]